MAFNWFRKKEIIDLRKGQNDIVVSDKIKQKFTNQQISNQAPSSATSQENRGFFSFFGSSSASEASSMQTPVPSPPSISSNSEILDKIERLNKRVDELFTGISRLVDRVDLNERKIERLERKTGVSENY